MKTIKNINNSKKEEKKVYSSCKGACSGKADPHPTFHLCSTM